MFAEVNTVGVGEEGYVYPLVDDEQGFVVCGASDVHGKFEEMTAREVFFAKLHDVYSAIDGESDLFDQGHVVAESAIRYEAESREGNGLRGHTPILTFPHQGGRNWCDGLGNVLGGAAG